MWWFDQNGNLWITGAVSSTGSNTLVPSDEVYLTSHDWEEIRQLETLYLLPDERQ